jgi:hypothetical protein
VICKDEVEAQDNGGRVAKGISGLVGLEGERNQSYGTRKLARGKKKGGVGKIRETEKRENNRAKG